MRLCKIIHFDNSSFKTGVFKSGVFKTGVFKTGITVASKLWHNDAN